MKVNNLYPNRLSGDEHSLRKMNDRNDVPGNGFQLDKCATSLTESSPRLENTSKNHLILGNLMDWFYSGLGEIGQPKSSVAYKEITINPGNNKKNIA